MPESQVCRLWCLIDDEKKAFYVDASPRWNVQELADVIQQRRLHLRNIDILDLVLWKVRAEAVLLIGVNVCAHFPSQLKHPIPIAPASTLPQRLPSPITDLSVALEEPRDIVSKVFPHRPESHLHIIVTLPGKQIHGHLCMIFCI